MRVFVALNLPTSCRQELHESLTRLRNSGVPLRWVPPDAMHLTLRFLGDIEGSEVARIDEVLHTTARQYGPVTLRIRGIGAFPSLRRMSVLWLGVDADEGLSMMQAELDLAFSRLGYARETRPYRPHITVARTRSGARAPDIERSAAAISVAEEVVVDSIDLMRSHTGPDGSRYELLLRAPLSGVGIAT